MAPGTALVMRPARDMNTMVTAPTTSAGNCQLPGDATPCARDTPLASPSSAGSCFEKITTATPLRYPVTTG